MNYIRIYPWPNCDGNSYIERAEEADQPVLRACRAVGSVPNATASTPPARAVSERDIRTILEHRRRREQFFEEELFADPAWDILLELYAATLGQLRMSTGSVCVGAAVPATTALRWIKVLEDKNLVERKGDPLDGRRIYLSLSKGALDALTNYFRDIPAETRLI